MPTYFDAVAVVNVPVEGDTLPIVELLIAELLIVPFIKPNPLNVPAITWLALIAIGTLLMFVIAPKSFTVTCATLVAEPYVPGVVVIAPEYAIEYRLLKNLNHSFDTTPVCGSTSETLGAGIRV
jgi:hypothetical protein